MNGSNADDVVQLMALARSGQGNATGQLLEFYRGYLSILARLHCEKRLQSKFDASDAVQETLLQAHCRFSQFQGQTARVAQTHSLFAAWQADTPLCGYQTARHTARTGPEC